MKAAFIGLGRMGTAMADRVLAAGHDLAVYNRDPRKADDLVARGAKPMGSVAEAARYGAVVITMLGNDAALSAVTLGEEGLIAAMPKGATHIVMGTHSVSLIKALTAGHADAGQVLVGAPVMGRPPVAAAGQLGILAGGPPAAVEACAPLFAAMGRRTFDAGTEPMAAAAAKIANNLVLACAIEAMAEGFALAEKCGVAGAAFLDILTDGVFAAPAYKTYGKIIADKAYFGEAGFTATTGLKDINLALAAGEAVGVPMPALNASRDRLLSAIAQGHGDRDWTVMALEQMRASGIG
jgi:3-hydroxyisobutyrate dehydrogenase-like beta-hydroxyacid dehydrogenase